MNQYSVVKTPHVVMMEIAHRHKQIRRIQGMSQSEMAKRSGVSLGSLKRFEQTGQISLESFLKLLHLLDRLDELNLILAEKGNIKDIEKLFD